MLFQAILSFQQRLDLAFKIIIFTSKLLVDHLILRYLMLILHLHFFQFGLVVYQNLIIRVIVITIIFKNDLIF